MQPFQECKHKEDVHFRSQLQPRIQRIRRDESTKDRLKAFHKSSTQGALRGWHLTKYPARKAELSEKMNHPNLLSKGRNPQPQECISQDQRTLKNARNRELWKQPHEEHHSDKRNRRGNKDEHIVRWYKEHQGLPYCTWKRNLGPMQKDLNDGPKRAIGRSGHWEGT